MAAEWIARTPSPSDWHCPADYFPGNLGIVSFDSSAVPSSSSPRSSLSASLASRPNPRPLPPPPDIKHLAGVPDSASSKLGKATCFEDTAQPRTPPSPAARSVAAAKKTKAPRPTVQRARCQVEGCDSDLSSAKDYHRKHRVCDAHSKCPRVVVAGHERRFCQQCSRFHALSEFDHKKRSCRRRLSDHNARRRKPQLDAFSFDPASLSSPFYDDRRQISFLWTEAPFGPMRDVASSTWEGLSDFKLSQMKEPWMIAEKDRRINGELHLDNSQLSNVFPTYCDEIDGLLPIRPTAAQVFNQGPEVSATASRLERASDLRRAPSLLSFGSWGSPEAASSPVQLSHTNQASTTQHVMNAGDAAAACWLDGLPLAQQLQVVPSGVHVSAAPLLEFQLLKLPYESTSFGSNHIPWHH